MWLQMCLQVRLQAVFRKVFRRSATDHYVTPGTGVHQCTGVKVNVHFSHFIMMWNADYVKL